MRGRRTELGFIGFLGLDPEFLKRVSDFLGSNPTVTRSFERHGCTLADEAMIRHYTNEGYGDLNDVLEHGSLLTAPLQEAKNTLTQALAKLPNDVTPIIHRGLGEAASAAAATWVNGQVITSKKFWSCSRNELVAKRFKDMYRGNVLLRIKHKSGKYINDVSMYNNQQEVLMSLGVNCKVTNIDITSQPGTRIIDLIEL